MAKPKLRIQEAIDNVLKGGAPCVFIDDSGLPGTNIKGVSSEEKIFCSVVAPPSCSKEVMEASFEISEELQKISMDILGISEIKEFHFCHIYHASKEYKDVPLQARIGLFEFMAKFLVHYPLEVITVGLEESRNKEFIMSGLPEHLPPIDFRKVEQTAFWFLIFKLRDYFTQKSYPSIPSAFCDVGLAKQGTAIQGNVPFLKNFFKHAIFFIDSSLLPGIQIADFAAFMLSRHKVVLGKWQNRQRLNQMDEMVIELMNYVYPKYTNLPKKMFTMKR
jgi:hypothetical protein